MLTGLNCSEREATTASGASTPNARLPFRATERSTSGWLAGSAPTLRSRRLRVRVEQRGRVRAARYLHFVVTDADFPKSLKQTVGEIAAFTDQLCAQRLDAEYADLCRRLIGKLARKRPTPLVRGAPRIWAAGVLYAVGRVNFLFDRSQPIHLSGDELAALTAVPKTTMANKATRICELVALGPLDFEFSRRDLLQRNPFAWLVEVNGIPVDARWLPPELQAEARRRGLIPDLPSTEAA